MPQQDLLESAMAAAEERLTSWRATRSPGSPYPNDVLQALAHAARLSSPGDVCRRLNVGWYRVIAAMNDPRFRDVPDGCGEPKESSIGLQTAETPVSRQRRADNDPCITFTQLVPVEMETQSRTPAQASSPAIEVAVGQDVTIRLYDLSSDATTFLHNLALSVVREVRT